ncbi:MAG TPA: hypothetical protein VMH05_14405 [Bryobacteraceae bacterium]|nr:hypothetical protein [Bryobacteraceae bacterium]
MCDYSLHLFPNRLGADGEELVVHRFGGASLGLASPSELPVPQSATESGGRSRWARIKSWFQRPLWEAEKRVCAVCIPPGSRLIVRDIPKTLQRELGVEETEQVTFTQISAEVNTYRDAIRFNNGRQLLLQRLREGQRITVVSLSPAVEDELLVDTDARVANL